MPDTSTPIQIRPEEAITEAARLGEKIARGAKLFAKLREGGRVDLLDHHLGPDGLDITILTPPKKK